MIADDVITRLRREGPVDWVEVAAVCGGVAREDYYDTFGDNAGDPVARFDFSWQEKRRRRTWARNLWGRDWRKLLRDGAPTELEPACKHAWREGFYGQFID